MSIPKPPGIPRAKGFATKSGAPKPPRTTATRRALTADPGAKKPPWFRGSQPEWAVWRDLVYRRGMIPAFDPRTRRTRRDFDFQFQAAIPVTQVNANTPFFRGDFWIPPGRKGGYVGYPYSRGLVLDPITGFTHDQPGEDRYRRTRLAQFGFLLVWIEARDLVNRPHEIVGRALRGADESSIGKNKR